MSNTSQSPIDPGMLAEQLKAARGSLLATDLAERASWPISKISKIEHGKQDPTQEDLTLWADLTGTDEATLLSWRTMLVATQQARRALVTQMRAGQRAMQRRFTEIIARETRFSAFETTVMPRMLQTPDYTRAILTEASQRFAGARDIEAGVAERQASVPFLFDTDKQFDLLITEPVLGWRPAVLGTPVHRAQLVHLRNLQNTFKTNGNVRFGIVPLFQPISWLPRNPFNILGDYAVAEHWVGEIQFLLTDELERLHQIMDKLWETAHTGDRAIELIDYAIERLDRAGGQMT